MNTAEIKNIKTSVMGTIEFDLKAKGQRGFQSFIVYPINAETKIVKIQSNKRIGSYNPATGEIKLSKSRSGGSYFHHLQLDNLTTAQLSGIDNQGLKMAIFTTSGSKVGNKVIRVDNSKAVSIFDL